ncbi:MULTISPECIES: HU family DNA-binding protein [unclassified Moritella]
MDVPVKYSGRLTVIYKEERPGRNPKTGEKVHIKRKAYVHFKLGKVFIII